MPNNYYNGGSFPATGSPATSASMRAELAAITAGFDKLPVLSGNAEKLIRVNASGTALEVASGAASLTLVDSSFFIQDNGDATKQIRFEVSTLSTGATRVLTVPDANFTFVGADTTQTLSNKTINGAVLNDGYTEEVFAVTGTAPALSPTNGSIQTWTLTANSTPTAGTWAAGQSMTLMVDDGSAYTITWTSMAVTWKTESGTVPSLNLSGFTAIVLWKVGSTIYGARVGNA